MISTKFVAGVCIGLTAVVMTSASWAQQAPVTAPPKDGAQLTPSEESPPRQPPSNVDANGKSVPATAEKLVLADPATKLYMPCRDRNDSLSADEAAKSPKLNPKAAVLSEEAAKQHGYKPSPHKVVCPK